MINSSTKLIQKMSTPKRYLITSAPPYANGLKHVGRFDGAYIPADIYVRYHACTKRCGVCLRQRANMALLYSVAGNKGKAQRRRQLLISIMWP